MTRYFTRSCDDDLWGREAQISTTVHEADSVIDTGLLDHRGEKIFRAENGPLGFDLTPHPRVRVKAISRRLKSD